MTTNTLNSRPLAWTLWITASIFFAYQYIIRVLPNILLDDVMLQFGVGAAAYGQFSGIYYIGYSLMHLPIGIMLDRFGPRKVMTGCILMVVLGLLPLIFADKWAYPVAGRLLIGIGSSAAILGVFKIVRMAFSLDRFPRMLSFSVTIGLIGAIYGGGPVSLMRDQLGYQIVVEILALAGVALAIATFFVVPEIESTPQSSVFKDIKQVFSNKLVILACLSAGMMVGPLEGFADVWGTAFLKQIYGFENSVAASIPSMIFLGMCFGGPILSFITERTGNYFATIIGTGVIMAVSFLALLTGKMPAALLSTSFVLVGICCAYQIIAVFKISTLTSENLAGITTAAANMIIMIFGYVFHTVMGNVISAFGGPLNPDALLYGVGVIPFALLLGTAGFVYVYAKEKKTITVAA